MPDSSPEGHGSDDPKKAPIDQWLSGEISTIDVIDRLLGFFGISLGPSQRRDDDDEDA